MYDSCPWFLALFRRCATTCPAYRVCGMLIRYQVDKLKEEAHKSNWFSKLTHTNNFKKDRTFISFIPRCSLGQCMNSTYERHLALKAVHSNITTYLCYPHWNRNWVARPIFYVALDYPAAWPLVWCCHNRPVSHPFRPDAPSPLLTDLVAAPLSPWHRNPDRPSGTNWRLTKKSM